MEEQNILDLIADNYSGEAISVGAIAFGVATYMIKASYSRIMKKLDQFDNRFDKIEKGMIKLDKDNVLGDNF